MKKKYALAVLSIFFSASAVVFAAGLKPEKFFPSYYPVYPGLEFRNPKDVAGKEWKKEISAVSFRLASKENPAEIAQWYISQFDKLDWYDINPAVSIEDGAAGQVHEIAAKYMGKIGETDYIRVLVFRVEDEEALSVTYEVWHDDFE